MKNFPIKECPRDEKASKVEIHLQIEKKLNCGKSAIDLAVKYHFTIRELTRIQQRKLWKYRTGEHGQKPGYSI